MSSPLPTLVPTSAAVLVAYRDTPDYYGPGLPLREYWQGLHRYTGTTRTTCNPESALPLTPTDAAQLTGWQIMPAPERMNSRGVFNTG